jgi:ribosome-associated toxin RatA of RatAB toxin-antitoxin module
MVGRKSIVFNKQIKKIVTLSVALLMVTALNLSAGPGKFTGLDEATYKRLMTDGQLIVVDRDARGKTRLVTGGVIIAATPTEVAKVVADFAAYHEWMPQTEEVSVSKRKGNIWETDYELDFEFSLISIGIDYTLRQIFNLPETIEFKRIRGDIKKSVGSWTFYPIDGGQRCAVFYSALSDMKSVGKVISYILKQQPVMELAIQSSTAILVVESLKKRVEGLKKKGAIADPAGWSLIAPTGEN